MAGTKTKGRTRKAPTEGPDGVDRWTSNGRGITMKRNTEEQQRVIDRINRELSEGKAKIAGRDKRM